MKAIKERIFNALAKAGLSIIKRKSPILKAVLDDPESLMVQTYIENDEVVLRIRKRESD